MFVNRFLGNTENSTVKNQQLQSKVFFSYCVLLHVEEYFEIRVGFFPGLHLNTIIESIFIKPDQTKPTTLQHYPIWGEYYGFEY